MSDSPREIDAGDDRGVSAFEPLRDRPTPELDSTRLWRRIEAGMSPRGAPAWKRLLLGGGPVPRRALGVALLGALLLAAWLALPSGPVESPRFVLLAPADGGAPGVEAAPAVVPTRLDVRLVRGYDGVPPADVGAAAAMGVGGADALRDVRAEIEALLPFESYGVVGAWQGSVTPGEALDVELAEAYRLVARSSAAGGERLLELGDLELVGPGTGAAPADLSLAPGKLYILGVLEAADDTPDLVLLIRAEPEER